SQGKRLHYHLGAADASIFNMRPNNLIFWNIILWAKEHGFSVFNLGGGRSNDDSLFRFKAQFSRNRLGFYCGRHIHRGVLYWKLIEETRVSSVLKLNGYNNFFPLYRLPECSGALQLRPKTAEEPPIVLTASGLDPSIVSRYPQ